MAQSWQEGDFKEHRPIREDWIKFKKLARAIGWHMLEGLAASTVALEQAQNRYQTVAKTPTQPEPNIIEAISPEERTRLYQLAQRDGRDTTFNDSDAELHSMISNYNNGNKGDFKEQI